MIEISDKKNCTGCGACINACPKNIISFIEDEEGFIYPHVEAEDCINCRLCEKSCPMLKQRVTLCPEIENYPQYFAGQLINEEDLLSVSSGGAFWAFSQTVVDKGGIVYGAVQDNVDEIYHFRASDIDGIKRIRRSKYLQSDTRLTMSQVKEDLKNGLFVLYSGTGCQIAGLKAFLGKDCDNLITCEVVCHGVPSRSVWKKYRAEKEQCEGKTIEDIVFRDKSDGWSHNQYKITYNDGSVEKEASPKQMFHAGYLKGLFYRPSCGSCKWASLPRVSDITLADYWKYIGGFHLPGKDLGVSLIIVNTEKGLAFFDKATKYLNVEKTSNDLALGSCKHLNEHPSENPNRLYFFDLFQRKGYKAAYEKYIKECAITRLKRRIKSILKNIRASKGIHK